MTGKVMGVGYLTTFPQRGRRQARLNQPQLLVGVSQRGGGFDRVGTRHRQVEALARQDFSDGDHLPAIVFAGEQRVLELACGASFHDDFSGKGEFVGFLVEDYPIGKYRSHPSGRQHL